MNVTPPRGIGCCEGAIVIMEIYPVYMGEESIGKVQLQKNGLYYRIECECALPGSRIFRLYAECGDWKYRIGIPVPEGDSYKLRVNIRFEKLQTDDLRFFVATDEDQATQQRIPIFEEKPCQQMAILEVMVFDRYNGRPYLRLKSDQNYSLLDM